MTEAINMDDMSPTKKAIIRTLQDKFTKALTTTPVQCQRVEPQQQRVRVDNPNLTIPGITDAPAIITARNPTAKRVIKTTPRIHRRTTRNNTPGQLPLIKK